MNIPTKHQIIETYNYSVNSISEAQALASSQKLPEMFQKINESANNVYKCLEWFIKFQLIQFYPDTAVHIAQRNTIDRGKFPEKVALFIATYPSDNEGAGILLLAQRLKQSVRNDPEHSGGVPHFNSLLEVIRQCRILFKNYLGTNLSELAEINQEVQEINKSDWISFLSESSCFSKGANYILISGKVQNNLPVSSLGLISWNVIFDFDPSSQSDGLFKIIKENLTARRFPHYYTMNDSLPQSFSAESTYCIFSNGMDGRNGTHFPIFRDWNRNYSTFLERVIEKMQADLSSIPTIVVITYDSKNEVSELLRLLYKHFGNSVRFVMAIDDPGKLEEIREIYDNASVKISLLEIADAIERIGASIAPQYKRTEHSLPHKDQPSINVSDVDHIWASEDIEIIYKDLIIDELKKFDESERLSFYKGGTISWKGLHFNYDIPRDATFSFSDQVERLLRQRIVNKIPLNHYPGVGGSTIVRRVAWNLHQKYPVAFIKKIRIGETVERIYKLFQLTYLPPLIIAESSNVNEDAFNQKLYNEVAAKGFPAIFLWVQRKSNKKPDDKTYIPDILTDIEAHSFANAYSELAPNRRSEIFKVPKSNESQERHPLFFGLVAFEEKFNGLAGFVEKACLTGSSEQLQIVGFISFVGVYANKQITASVFAGILNLSETTIIKLQSYLTPELLHLIKSENDLSWRPLHFLIGKQFLIHLLGRGDVQLMRSGLVEYSTKFIDLLADRSHTLSREEMVILDRLFIERNEDVEGQDEEFSALIADGLQDDYSRLTVFKKLTDRFPDEAHFWSHLARFYIFRMKDASQALDSINRAIAIEEKLNGNDATLYHIKGMIYKTEASRVMESNWGNKNLDKEVLQVIQNDIDEYNIQFRIAREKYNKSEYGYTSNIDGIARYIDFKFSISQYLDRATFMINLNSYDLQLFNEARELLEEIFFKKVDAENDYYITRSSNNLNALLADHAAIIQGWNNLLDPSKSGAKDIVRKLLVYAYVSRANGWENLSKKDVERIIKLMEENIEADPSDSKSIFLWFRVARYSSNVSIATAIDKVVKWQIRNESLESRFYLGVLHTIEAIRGNSFSKLRAEECLDETSRKSRSLPNRSYSSEWLGRGVNMGKMVTRRIAINKDEANEIIFNKDVLEEAFGKIIEIKGPEAGTIELTCGLKAFFIPARANNGKGVVRGRDENVNVAFYLGFSYDGLKAFDVLCN